MKHKCIHIDNFDKIGNFLFFSPHPRPATSHFSNFQGVQSDHLMRRGTQRFCYELDLSYKLINVGKNCFSILTSKCLLLLHRFPRPTSAKVKVKNGVDLHLESTLVSKSARNSWTLSLPTEARWPPWYLEELLLSKKNHVVDNSNLIYHLQDFSPSHQDFFVLLSL